MQIHGASEERYGLVFFRQQEDQEKALNASKGKLFFGMQIEVTAWIGPGKLHVLLVMTTWPLWVYRWVAQEQEMVELPFCREML